MTKKILLTFTFLSCTGWMAAQSMPPSSGTPDSSSTTSGQTSSGQTSGASQSSDGMNGSEITLQGCLSGSGSSYMLTDAAGTQYQLQGDTSKLSSQVNSQVEVRGTTGSRPASGGDSAGSSSTGTATGTGTAQTFNVTKMKKLASSCSNTK